MDFSAVSSLLGTVFEKLNSLSWPVVTLILAIYFRRTILDLSTALVNVSQRVKKLGGVEVQPVEQQQPVEAVAASEVALLDVVGDDPDLQSWALDAEKIFKQANLQPAEVKSRLIRAWAYSNRARYLDRLGRQIFRTQVDALQKIAEGPTDGKALKRFHTEHVQRAGAHGIASDQIFDFQRWLQFLLSTGLVTKETPGPYSITNKGKAFLANALETGLPDASPM